MLSQPSPPTDFGMTEGQLTAASVRRRVDALRDRTERAHSVSSTAASEPVQHGHYAVQILSRGPRLLLAHIAPRHCDQ